MAYKVGISSGWWSIGKDQNLLGLALKAGAFGATSGVQFNQVDLDTILEFLEPDLKPILKRTLENLSIEVGLHGEVGQFIALESGERRYWENSHERLITSVNNGADMGFKYVNFHLSQSVQVQQLEREIRPFGFSYQVVAPNGKPFGEWIDEVMGKNKEAGEAMKNYAIERIHRAVEGNLTASEQDEYQNKRNEIEQEEQNKIEEKILKEEIETDQNYLARNERDRELYRIDYFRRRSAKTNTELNQILRKKFRDEVEYVFWKRLEIGRYILEAGEIDAYMLVAIYMQKTRDPIWMNIMKENIEAEKAYATKPVEFNAAIAAKYIEGHLKKKDHDANKRSEGQGGLGGMSVAEYADKKNFYVLFEMPHTQQGQEGLMKLYDPRHSYWLIKSVNAKYVKLCIDFEQTIANRQDLDKLLDDLEKNYKDIGEMTYLYHIGEPIPYFGTAHVPIMLGGRGMEILYRWFYRLRQLGFKDGIIIFERGSGRGGQGKAMNEVFEYSVYALRQIVKYLDQDIPVKELPPEFFGLSTENKEFYAQQYTAMREHFMDPMQDLMNIPEEAHTFLSKTAVDKQKQEVYKKRRFR